MTAQSRLNSLVADALELGRQLHMGAPDKNRLCAAFAVRYGLLGLNAEKGEEATDDPNGPPFTGGAGQLGIW